MIELEHIVLRIEIYVLKKIQHVCSENVIVCKKREKKVPVSKLRSNCEGFFWVYKENYFSVNIL